MNWTHNLGIWKERFLIPLDDPGSRLFHYNLIIAFLLIVLWMVLAKKDVTIKSLRKLILRKKYWWNKSTQLDYKIYLMNSLLKVFLFVPLLDFSFHISRFVSEFLVDQNGGEFAGFPSMWTWIALFTVVSFVWDDFLRFSQHLMMHKVPFLWKIHSTHHSARIMTPLTLFRNHPAESAIATLRNSLSLGVSTGLFVFLFEAQLTVLTILGVNVFGFLFNLLGANLRHSHVPLSFPSWIERFFISPVQHQIHHSLDPAHFDKNLGVSLAIWDRLVGSWVASSQAGRLKFGLPNRRRQTFWNEIFLLKKTQQELS